jgi:hypothetical protein
MITERWIVIEPKNVNAFPWNNRLGVLMSANARWVVPASHDERRYAVNNISEKWKQNKSYFGPLWAEVENGGAGAMLQKYRLETPGPSLPIRSLQELAQDENPNSPAICGLRTEAGNNQESPHGKSIRPRAPLAHRNGTPRPRGHAYPAERSEAYYGSSALPGRSFR